MEDSAGWKLGSDVDAKLRICLLFHWKCGCSNLQRILSCPVTNCISPEHLKSAASCGLRSKAQSFGL